MGVICIFCWAPIPLEYLSVWLEGPEVRVIWRVKPRRLNWDLSERCCVWGIVQEVLICQGISSYKERRFIGWLRGDWSQFSWPTEIRATRDMYMAKYTVICIHVQFENNTSFFSTWNSLVNGLFCFLFLVVEILVIQWLKNVLCDIKWSFRAVKTCCMDCHFGVFEPQRMNIWTSMSLRETRNSLLEIWSTELNLASSETHHHS